MLRIFARFWVWLTTPIMTWAQLGRALRWVLRCYILLMGIYIGCMW